MNEDTPRQPLADTQPEVYNLIRPFRREAPLPRNEIYGLLQDLYHFQLPEPNFYSQFLDGFPDAPVPTTIRDETFHPVIAFTNELSAKDWRDVAEPPAFVGGQWPPTRASDLLGCATANERCIVCLSAARRKTYDDEYVDWSGDRFKWWLRNILLRREPSLLWHDTGGYGLFARRRIPKDTIMGEYTGQIVPTQPDLDNDVSRYQYDIDVGRIVGAGETQPTAWVNSTRRGSVFRFMNHSCDPNALVEQGRCGMHSRILYVYALRDIEVDEQITIDYGKEWLVQRDEHCKCGSKKCMNPEKKERKRGGPKKDAAPTKGAKSKKEAATEKDTKSKGKQKAAENEPATEVRRSARLTKSPKSPTKVTKPETVSSKKVPVKKDIKGTGKAKA